MWSHTGQCLHRVPDTGATEGLQEAVAGLNFVTTTAKLHRTLEEESSSDEEEDQVNENEEKRQEQHALKTDIKHIYCAAGFY